MTPYDNIPLELRQENTWVNVWNNSKIPMQPMRRKGASSVKPDTWGSFEQAVKNVEEDVYDGIGYVFHDNGIVGIDIDVGYEDVFLSKPAIDIIGHCKSYTEKSRSGRGFHILIKGDIPFHGRNNRQGIEIYKSRRYFIVTGRVLIYSEIVEDQEAIDHVLETYFADVPKETESSLSPRIYSPIYPKPEGGKVKLKPDYPEITQGSRNLSLTSLAGQLHTQGYSKAEIFKELLYCNSVACKPPLNRSEVEMIVQSITKYRR